MCITVSSKHNVIRKMFSVIKYLVLVFAFVFANIFLNNSSVHAIDIGNRSQENEQGLFVGKTDGEGYTHNVAGPITYIDVAVQGNGYTAITDFAVFMGSCGVEFDSREYSLESDGWNCTRILYTKNTTSDKLKGPLPPIPATYYELYDKNGDLLTNQFQMNINKGVRLYYNNSDIDGGKFSNTGWSLVELDLADYGIDPGQWEITVAVATRVYEKDYSSKWRLTDETEYETETGDVWLSEKGLTDYYEFEVSFEGTGYYNEEASVDVTIYNEDYNPPIKWVYVLVTPNDWTINDVNNVFTSTLENLYIDLIGSYYGDDEGYSSECYGISYCAYMYQLEDEGSYGETTINDIEVVWEDLEGNTDLKYRTYTVWAFALSIEYGLEELINYEYKLYEKAVIGVIENLYNYEISFERIDPLLEFKGTSNNISQYSKNHFLKVRAVDQGGLKSGIDEVEACAIRNTTKTCSESIVEVKYEGNDIYKITFKEGYEDSYSIKVSVYDYAGNVTVATYNKQFAVDTLAPRRTMETSSDYFDYKLYDYATKTNMSSSYKNGRVTFRITDKHAVSSCKYKWKSSDDYASCSMIKEYRDDLKAEVLIGIAALPNRVIEGEITLYILLKDDKGNEKPTENVIKIDNYAPETSLKDGEGNPIIETVVLTGEGGTKAQNNHIFKIQIKEGRLNQTGSFYCILDNETNECVKDTLAHLSDLLKKQVTLQDGQKTFMLSKNSDDPTIYTLYINTSEIDESSSLDGQYSIYVFITDDAKASKLDENAKHLEAVSAYGTHAIKGSILTAVFDNTEIMLDTNQTIGISTMKDDDTSISGISPMIGNFSVRAKIEISDEHLIFSDYVEVSSDNIHLSYSVKEEGKTGKINTITCEIKYSVVEQSNKQYLYIIVGNCEDSNTSARHGKLIVTVTIDSSFITDEAGNGCTFKGDLPVMTVELRLGSKNDFAVQTVAKQETTSNEEEKSTQVTTLNSVIEREEILVEEIREANVKEVVIPLEETNMVIQVDERLVEITIEEVEEKETEKEIVVVVDENTEIVVINYGSMSYEYKVKEITSNLNREVILHELMVSNKRVLVKLKSMKEH